MTLDVAERESAETTHVVPRRADRRRRLPVHWPLTVTLLGYPLWWLLGIQALVPIAAAGVMAWQLSGRRKIALPPAFGLWLLFLVWVGISVFTLWADAPGAIPGGGPARLVPWAYRTAWLLTAAIAALWVYNLSERDLPSRHVRSLFAFMFLVTVTGGLLGTFLSTVQLTSALELLLPGSLKSQGFVRGLVHPAFADIQTFLGRAEARPRAPYASSNSWGSAFSLFLPFFLASWLVDGRRWQRYAAPVVLLVAAVPVIYSLNRGLWGTLVLGLVIWAVLLLRSGRPLVIGSALIAAVTLLVAFALSPLGALVNERLANAHSNDRRSQLLIQTVTSTVQGSPVVGFGSTRDYQGSFASIAGASTPDCSACGVPPLGTQGQLWLVIFAYGLVGAALFLTFWALALRRNWRCRTLNETVAFVTVVFFLTQLVVYDTIDLPMMTVMIAVTLAARDRREGWGGRRAPARPTVGMLVADLRAGGSVILVCAVAGTLLGLLVSQTTEQQYVATRSVLLKPPLVSLESTTSGRRSERVTVDTEAALVVSARSLRRVLPDADPAQLQELADRIRITAPPNTTVLNIAVEADAAGLADRQVTAVADAYLRERQLYLAQRRRQQESILRDQLQRLGGGSLPQLGDPSTATGAYAAAEDTLRQTREAIVSDLVRLRLEPGTAGEVITVDRARPERRQTEVPIASGLALGLGLGLVIGPRMARRRRRLAEVTPDL